MEVAAETIKKKKKYWSLLQYAYLSACSISNCFQQWILHKREQETAPGL